ncbi:hypothetical protein EV368DRAFT_67792 [Lentinula lateritia]|nr:hypothetical protein EV368DRAFT_67792 [Lentinula lateritia]
MSTCARNLDSILQFTLRPDRQMYPKASTVNHCHKKSAAALPGNSSNINSRQLPTVRPPWIIAVDLGCGTDQATTELSPFKTVIVVEPSKGMVQENTLRTFLVVLPIDLVGTNNGRKLLVYYVLAGPLPSGSLLGKDLVELYLNAHLVERYFPNDLHIPKRTIYSPDNASLSIDVKWSSGVFSYIKLVA